MSRWKHKLNLSGFYDLGTIDVTEKGKRVAAKIRRLPLESIECYCGGDFLDLADQFEHVGDTEETTAIEEFDYAMDELYDMADRYSIWVEI